MPDVAMVWSVAGSTVSALMVFVLPSAFYLRIRKHKPFSPRKLAAWANLIGGVLVMILCTGSSMSTLLAAEVVAAAGTVAHTDAIN